MKYFKYPSNIHLGPKKFDFSIKKATSLIIFTTLIFLIVGTIPVIRSEFLLQANAQPPMAGYIFSLDSITIGNTASLHEDTDGITFSVQRNSENPITISRDLGDVNNGIHVVNLQVPLEVKPGDTISFAYGVANKYGGGILGWLSGAVDEYVKKKYGFSLHDIPGIGTALPGGCDRIVASDKFIVPASQLDTWTMSNGKFVPQPPPFYKVDRGFWDFSCRDSGYWVQYSVTRTAPNPGASPSTNSGYLLQSSFGSPGNFELAVPRADSGFNYFWRDNTAPGLPWNGPGSVANIAGKIDSLSMIQSSFGTTGDLEMVARQGDHLVFFWREDKAPFTWHGPYDLPNSGGVGGNPSQSFFGDLRHGNFELVVPRADSGFNYFWRDNSAPDLPWHGPFPVATGSGKIDALSMMQSSFGTTGDLEMVARQGDHLVFFWREDKAPFQWFGPYDMPNSAGVAGMAVSGGATPSAIMGESFHGVRNGTTTAEFCKNNANYTGCLVGTTAAANLSSAGVSRFPVAGSNVTLLGQPFCKSNPQFPGCSSGPSSGLSIGLLKNTTTRELCSSTPSYAGCHLSTAGAVAGSNVTLLGQPFCKSNPQFPGCSSNTGGAPSSPINLTGGNKTTVEGIRASDIFCKGTPNYPGCPK
jgi:hypothetical protein